MRVRLIDRGVTVTPKQTVSIVLEVTNDLEVIDGIRAEMVVGPGLDWSAKPEVLPLFPDTSGRITIEMRATPTFPAGTYGIPVVAHSSVGEDEGRDELVLTVRPVPAADLKVEPLVRSSRHKVRFDVEVDNSGNTPLEIALGASDPNRVAPAKFSPSVVKVGPGASSSTRMTVVSRRHFLGGERSHQVSVLGSAPELEVESRAVFRQRPIIPRGVRTAMILACIVALWAGIFAVVLKHALANDPITKSVPASFYASVAKQVNQTKLQSLGGAHAPVGLASAASPPPAGAVPKSGVVIGVGGTIAGTVDAASTKSGIGRINVEVVQLLPTGPLTIASAATAANGSYSIAGLLPGTYKILFEAQGFVSQWYPSVASEAAAKVVTVQPLATTGHIDATIAGSPGSITGIVDTGVKPAAPVTVTVQPQQGATTPIATVKSNSAGSYTISNLPTPGVYDLSFTSPQYVLASATEQLSGGEALIANTVTLTAANGSISGTVTGGGAPLGGVSITAEANGETFTSATPTSGPVGQFSLLGLPSPATYLITFTKTGYGTRVIGEDLGPGQNLKSLKVVMSGGAGDISGEVLSTSGVPLGGATVTVDGANPAVTTQTLTAGTIGTYSLSGLATPGTYTLTFSAPGYESQTIAVPLGSSGSAQNIEVKLPADTGTITGKVTDASGHALTGVTVTATNGTTQTTTTSTSQPPGGFLFAGLAPGSYSITFSMTGDTSQTFLVALQPGQTATLDAELQAG